jgi:NAD kinase
VYEQAVVVVKKTALEELLERHNTRSQAQFFVESRGADFSEYEAAHEAYRRALDGLLAALPRGLRRQVVERSFLPNFLFGDKDLVLALGPDGLVANLAKYAGDQPIIPVNPDPSRVDGVLAAFSVAEACAATAAALEGAWAQRLLTMARASLNDGQELHAVNDLFIGRRTHVSALYRIAVGGRAEEQSSSGVIVSTGVGSTGWLSSVLEGAAGIASANDGAPAALREGGRFDWEARELRFAVREPFVSKTSAAGLVFGKIPEGKILEMTSRMPQDGVIFSDGVEADALPFVSGSIARIEVATRRVRLLVPERLMGKGRGSAPPARVGVRRARAGSSA